MIFSLQRIISIEKTHHFPLKRTIFTASFPQEHIILFSNALFSLNYYDITKRLVTKQLWIPRFEKKCEGLKLEFSKMFLKKNGKLYSSTVPIYIKKFLITKNKLNPKNKKDWKFIINNLGQKTKHSSKIIPKVDVDRQKCISMFLKSSELIKNESKPNHLSNNALVLVKFLNYPFNKSIGITEQVLLYTYTKNPQVVQMLFQNLLNNGSQSHIHLKNFN